jgi:hypothetical protein
MKEWVAVGTGRVNWVGLAKEVFEFVKRGKPRVGALED